MTYDTDIKYKRRVHHRISCPPRITLLNLILGVLLCIGFYLVVTSSYNLYVVVPSKLSNPYSIEKPQKNAWIFAKHNYHLKVILHVLSHAGYKILTSQNEPKQWDLLWAHDYPFLIESLMNLKQYQMVNKLPGTSSITLKVELARTKLKWIPQAFAIPEEEGEFNIISSRYPNKLWVQKSNNHRGIKIVSSNKIDKSKGSTFVQEFIENPMLIDKKKFDIGVYVVYTSVDPLQLYIFEDEVLFRFCTEDYLPLDPGNPNKYVVGADYIPLDKMPSLKKYYNHGQMSFKNAFFSYLSEKGFDPYQMWNDMKHCITEVFKSKSKEMVEKFKRYSFKKNFFELVRVDFVPDEKGNVWLMEINMSPNLSPDSHPINRMMYTKVVRGALELAGVLTTLDERSDGILSESSARIRDIIMPNQQCANPDCLKCESPVCYLCSHCLNDDIKHIILKAYREHRNKGGFKRLLPFPLNSDGTKVNAISDPTGEYDAILGYWFKQKCLKDISWCQ